MLHYVRMNKPFNRKKIFLSILSRSGIKSLKVKQVREKWTGQLTKRDKIRLENKQYCSICDTV